MGSDYVAAKMY